uniref:PH domain-containing protein n=1 Tax=Neogobius melanostomus TaxID=47308 RepID=A0A8C6TQY4_9GOBI
MFAEERPDGEAIIRRQSQVDKQYAGLKELAEDRRKKLDHTYQHFLLSREVEELEQWIAERDVVASSQEMGQDLDHVTLLRDKFREFARETGMVGQDRVDFVNMTIDELIEGGHSEAAKMAEWKDGINESWADLLELIDTRGQLLTASYDLLKYFDDGKELVAQINEKQNELPEDVGEDFSKAESFHRVHGAFERDITALGKQVQQYQETAARLHAQYAGEQAEAIAASERDVLQAWKSLLEASDGRRAQLVDTADKFKFFTMVRDLMAWMESIIQQIETQEKPRDVSSVELLQKYHQGIRSEIEARGAKFTGCIDLGKALLARKHRDSAEIKEKLVQLMEKRKEMMFKWTTDGTVLEVCQFARDASVAEAWLIAQEPYVSSRDLGHNVDEVEKLIKRHEAFEKSTATWEERFSALERLTTVRLYLETIVITAVPSTSQLEGTAGDTTVPIESEMKESRSLELDPSVSVPSLKEPERAFTLPLESLQSPAQAVLLEGLLGRKLDVEGTGKKASNRSWTNLYCVLRPGQLSVYKDAKSFGQGLTYHGEEPLTLTGAIWEILSNYKKKKHVAKLRLTDGSEYLFQCKDEEELQRWSQAIERAMEAPTEQGPLGAKTQSLPPVSSSTPESSAAKKDKEKKFSRFAKKK